MFLTDGVNITLRRGDTANVKFILTEDDGQTPFMLPEGQLLRIDVSLHKSVSPVITKTADQSDQDPDGTVCVFFSGTDTDIPANVYRYTVRLLNSDGSRCDTLLGFPADAFFAVGMNAPPDCGYSPDGDIRVTVTQADSAFPQYEGDYTVTPDLMNDIVLATKHRSLYNNISVQKVPSAEVENESGGITFIIGG